MCKDSRAIPNGRSGCRREYRPWACSAAPRLALALLSLATCQACSADKTRLWSDSPVSLHLGRTAGPPVVGDVNIDGHADIVCPFVESEEGGAGRLGIYFGDGTGGFTRSDQIIPVGFPGRALKVVLGDVDGDSQPDAAIAQHDADNVVLLGGHKSQSRQFSVPKRVPLAGVTHPHTHSVALADVDRDGHLDLLATCADDNALAVLLGRGNGEFRPAPGSPYPAGKHPYEGLSVGDVNRDQNPDVAVPNLWGSAVTVLLGDGAGRLQQAPGSPISLADRPGFLTLAHLNGDHFLDMVVTHDNDAIVDILFGDGTGRMNPSVRSPIRMPQPVWTAVVDDLNRDGHNDIVLGGREDRVIVVFGAGNGEFRDAQGTIRTAHRMPGYVALGEFNGDNRPDLVVTYFEADVIDVYLSRKP